jgi:hypothetical protein
MSKGKKTKRQNVIGMFRFHIEVVRAVVREDVVNYHSDDVAEFGAVTSLLGSEVPRVFASLDMASIVMTGRLCCRRWLTGEDCVRPWCGPLPPATPPGIEGPEERKPRLAPAE